ncbi:hypothetical protein HMPREF1986_01967 [Oribacterium sp. oral taxon 078 str. F0263]|nr:hypothetical protein GCWU000341_00227 [Oribacterium sp. oral taxon 078 str. F0262]ERL20686.1 hypothetical protein HMPREF1986_01967 [Oribacterium sp. oral taxon 078 str. F0263]
MEKVGEDHDIWLFRNSLISRILCSSSYFLKRSLSGSFFGLGVYDRKGKTC